MNLALPSTLAPPANSDSVLVVQNSVATSIKNMFASALNSSEFRMMMDAFALPGFMRRALGGDLTEETRATWDQKCKDYYEAMGSPPSITWMDVLIPFGISLDSASQHKAYRKEAVRPRVTLHEEFKTLFEHARTGLQFDLWDALKQAFSEAKAEFRKTRARSDKTQKEVDAAWDKEDAIDYLKSKYGTVDFYVKCQFECFPKAKKKEDKGSADDTTPAQLAAAKRVHEIVKAAFNSKKKEYLERNGVDWEKLFRRDQAVCDHRWLVFLPEQIMPLGNTTPDLHQVAEMLVGIYKGFMKKWAMGLGPTSKEVLFAANYDEAMQAECMRKNNRAGDEPSEEMATIRKTIHRMWVTCQAVATEYGVWFLPEKFEPAAKQEPKEMGTGGMFPRKGRS